MQGQASPRDHRVREPHATIPLLPTSGAHSVPIVRAWRELAINLQSFAPPSNPDLALCNVTVDTQ